jgi:hypothetical protein
VSDSEVHVSAVANGSLEGAAARKAHHGLSGVAVRPAATDVVGEHNRGLDLDGVDVFESIRGSPRRLSANVISVKRQQLVELRQSVLLRHRVRHADRQHDVAATTRQRRDVVAEALHVARPGVQLPQNWQDRQIRQLQG